ncbi:MAG: Mth938-like domain-containing protein [Xanthomonadales bacterium]|nr:Mth938-like domain-containing protein [Xanthomonadales bacterium]
MPLNLETYGDQQFIRSVQDDHIIVGETTLSTSFILTPESLFPEWEVQQASDLSEALMAPLLEHDPELVVLGTGSRQIFPDTQLLLPFLRQGVGVEVMSTDAACRTFNICVHENRRVVAGIIFPG